MIGKPEKKVSNDWKKRGKSFQSLEKNQRGFPTIGKTYFGLILLLVSFFGGEVQALDRTGGVGMQVDGVISAGVRFYVTGPNRGEDVAVAGWAEQVVEQVEGLLGETIPVRSGEPLVHIVIRMKEGEPSRVWTHEATGERGLKQTLFIQNGGAGMHVEVMKGLCGLLLNRVGSKVPDWLVTGVAHVLLPSMRVLDHERVLAAWEQGENVRFGAILAGELTPAELQGAACGELVMWLLSLPKGQAGLRSVLDQASAGWAVDAEWVARELCGVEEVRQAEQQWDLWLAERRNVVMQPGRCSLRDIQQLKKALVVRPDRLSVLLAREVDVSLQVGQLIGLRDEPWMGALCEVVAADIEQVVMGKSAKLRFAGGLYCAYLAAVGGSEEARFGSMFRRKASDEELVRMLGEAVRTLVYLENTVRSGQGAGGLSSNNETDESFLLQRKEQHEAGKQ